MVEGDRAELADILTAVSKTAAAGIGDLISGSRTAVAGDIDDFDNIGVRSVAAHSYLDTFGEYRAFLVHTAAHRRGLAGDDGLWNVEHIFEQCAFPRAPCDFAENLVFQILYFCIEFFHVSGSSINRRT